MKNLDKIDHNIVLALDKLIQPFFNSEHTKVYIRPDFRSNETGAEHIANSKHGLKTKDISCIPQIIKSPLTIIKDKRKGKSYFGNRVCGLKKAKYLKIVTQIRPDATEQIVTIFIVKAIKRK